MKRVMIVITMMLPLMTFASLFSERSNMTARGIASTRNNLAKTGESFWISS